MIEVKEDGWIQGNKPKAKQVERDYTAALQERLMNHV